MQWNEMPDLLTVREAYTRRAQLRGELTIQTGELAIEQAHVGMAVPRNPHARVVGADEASGAVLLTIQRKIHQLRAELDQVEAEIDWNNFHKEMFKALAYKERY